MFYGSTMQFPLSFQTHFYQRNANSLAQLGLSQSTAPLSNLCLHEPPCLLHWQCFPGINTFNHWQFERPSCSDLVT